MTPMTVVLFVAPVGMSFQALQLTGSQLDKILDYFSLPVVRIILEGPMKASL